MHRIRIRSLNDSRRAALLAAPLSLVLACCSSGQKPAPVNPGPAPAPGPAAGQDGTQAAAPPAAPVFPENDAFRDKQPEPPAPRSFQLPGVETFQLGTRDKIDVYLVERHTLPTVSLELNFDGGDMTDPASKAGLASVCMDMVSEGTAKLDKIAFDEALADIASDVSSYAGDDSQGVSMRTLSKSYDQTFALFMDTVLHPGMRKADFDRLVKRRLDGLKQVRGSAASVDRRLFGVVRYGARHPLGRVDTERSLKAMRLADCKGYVRRWLKPRGARLFVVGDLTRAQIEKSFAPLLAAWHGAPPRLRTPGRARPPRGRVFFVDIPGSAQSAITMIHPGPMRKADDYFPTQIMGRLLGGGFASRINMNLREDKGYSYGAYGGFTYNRWYGTFFAGTSVRVDSTYQSLIEMEAEESGLEDGSHPATEAEVAREKAANILSLPGRFDTAGDTLGQYRGLVYFRLPLDYYNSYVEKVSAVTMDQVKAAAKAHLEVNDAAYLVVGDGNAPQIQHETAGQKGADKPLTDKDGKPVPLRDALVELLASGKLGPGPLVIMDPDGKVLKTIRPPHMNRAARAGRAKGAKAAAAGKATAKAKGGKAAKAAKAAAAGKATATTKGAKAAKAAAH